MRTGQHARPAGWVNLKTELEPAKYAKERESNEDTNQMPGKYRA